jgi:hypothetical protein
MRALKPLEMAASIVGFISVIGAGAWAVDARWTPRVMFAGFQQQYQTDRSVDLLDRTNDRLWDIRQKLKKSPRNEELLKEQDTLELRKDRLKKQLEKIEGGAK